MLLTQRASRAAAPLLVATLAAAFLTVVPPGSAEANFTRVGMGGRLSSRYRATGDAPRLRRRYQQDAESPGEGGAVRLEVPNGSTAAGRRTVDYLTPRHYQSVRDAGVFLMREYNPRNHFFIAIGRSPVAIVTFLRRLNSSIAMTFPASDMRLNIRAEWKAEYFRHFEQTIPEDVVRGNRDIVLFDRARGGTSLAKLAGFLREWLGTKNSNIQVKSVGFTDANALASGVRRVPVSSFPNLFLYRQGQYDHDEGVAPYVGKHRIGQNTLDQLQSNETNYREFRRGLDSRMAADADLDRILSTEFGDLAGDGSD